MFFSFYHPKNYIVIDISPRPTAITPIVVSLVVENVWMMFSVRCGDNEDVHDTITYHLGFTQCSVTIKILRNWSGETSERPACAEMLAGSHSAFHLFVGAGASKLLCHTEEFLLFVINNYIRAEQDVANRVKTQK